MLVIFSSLRSARKKIRGEIMALEVTLSDQQDQALRGYLATLVRDEIDRVRDDEKINMLVYTRKNLAKACGISPATVDKW